MQHKNVINADPSHFTLHRVIGFIFLFFFSVLIACSKHLKYMFVRIDLQEYKEPCVILSIPK